MTCTLGPFQLIPYGPDAPAAKFTDQQNSTKALTHCSLQKGLVKFPDDVTEMELPWINESYVDLTVINKTLHFKVKLYAMASFSLIF